jgi:hypothetical protein
LKSNAVVAAAFSFAKLARPFYELPREAAHRNLFGALKFPIVSSNSHYPSARD